MRGAKALRRATLCASVAAIAVALMLSIPLSPGVGGTPQTPQE